jgi:hypothetical protein
MCDPVSMTVLMGASLGMSVLKGGADFLGQQQQEIANRHNAINSFNIQNRQTNIGIQQQESSDSQKAQESQREMIQSAATAAASAGESGTAGVSVDNLFNEYHATEGRYFNDVATQGQWNRTQAGVQKQGQAVQAQRQIMSVPKPNILGTALKIGGESLNKYTQLYGKPAS